MIFKLPEQIIKRPLLTEKGTAMGEEGNKVLFEVTMRANKIEIRKAVERIYNVKVKTVHTQIVRGKMKRQGRSVGKRPNWKRAIVTLAEGSSIDFFAAPT
jgi:large subunit ribosomal protein L23